MDKESLELRKAAANRWIIENAPKRNISMVDGGSFVEWDVLLEFMALYSHSQPISDDIQAAFL